MAHAMLSEERPLICGMCSRRICDITIFRGDVMLLRASQTPRRHTAARSGRAYS